MEDSSQHLTVTSHHTRRILGRLDRGDDLMRGTLAVCQAQQVRCARVQASGVLEEVALAQYDAAGRQMAPARHFRGALTLLWASGVIGELSGQLDLQLNVIVSRQRDNGIELLGGTCTAARVLTCELEIQVMEDVLVRRGIERGLGLPVISETFSAGLETAPSGADAPAPAAPTDAPGTPDEPPAAAPDPAPVLPPPEEPGEPEDLEPYRPIKSGDMIEHRQFGLCEVQRVSGDEEFVTVRLRNNRLVRLSLDVLDLRYKGDQDGHQVFYTAPLK
jgi:predicted DNA-binding protein with PD1-like motif